MLTRKHPLAAIAALTLLVSACGNTPAAGPTAAADPAKAAAKATAPAHAPAKAAGRIAISSPGSISILDAKTLEPAGTFASGQFTRLNAAGDGRHVLVTTTAGFQLLDTVEPHLTDLVFAATAAGHVVRHAGNTVLFDDGTGTTTILDTGDLAGADAALPAARTYTAPAAHHGVSIVLADGTLVTTVGDNSSRTGAAAFQPHGGHWDKAAESRECPGIHGEGTAAGEAVVFGCEDGALLFQGGTFTKLSAPDPYGRMGNAYVSETSPVVVGDYKDDPDAEGYLLNSVALIDTEQRTHTVVKLPGTINYTFRGVARGPGDLAYILSTNGSIHVLDPKDGKIVNEFPVIAPWDGPAQWQDAHPAIAVAGDTAYITEPATNSVHAVNLATGDVTASADLGVAPNEMAIT